MEKLIKGFEIFIVVCVAIIVITSIINKLVLTIASTPMWIVCLAIFIWSRLKG